MFLFVLRQKLLGRSEKYCLPMRSDSSLSARLISFCRNVHSLTVRPCSADTANPFFVGVNVVIDRHVALSASGNRKRYFSACLLLRCLKRLNAAVAASHSRRRSYNRHTPELQIGKRRIASPFEFWLPALSDSTTGASYRPLASRRAGHCL